MQDDDHDDRGDDIMSLLFCCVLVLPREFNSLGSENNGWENSVNYFKKHKVKKKKNWSVMKKLKFSSFPFKIGVKM